LLVALRFPHNGPATFAVQKNRQNAYFMCVNVFRMAGPSSGGEPRQYQLKERRKMSIVKNYRAWRRYRMTVSQLNRMSDHELRDIGVERGNIPFVARVGN